jgi:signal transduction histidine kinase
LGIDLVSKLSSVQPLIRSIGFHVMSRFNLWLMLLALALLIIFTLHTSFKLFDQLNRDVSGRLDYLTTLYQSEGIDALTEVIRHQSHNNHSASHLYYLRGKYYASEDSMGGFLNFLLALFDHPTDLQQIRLFISAREISPSLSLTIGRPYTSEFQQLVRLVVNVALMILCFWIGALITTAIATHRALAGMYALSVDLERIMESDTSEMLPTRSTMPFLTEVAATGNALLRNVSTQRIAMRRVADNIAHDLRTPLTRMRSRISRLRLKVPHELAGDADQLLGDCDHLLGSFNALLRISVLEAGTPIRLHDASVSLAIVLKDVIELYEPVAQSKQIMCVCRLARVPPLTGEAQLLAQLFANLLDNAIKYTPAEGCVTVASYLVDPRHVCVSISDTGRGIPDDEKRAVFEPFYRCQAPDDRAVGHGLGLSLVRAIVHYHRGVVTLHDNHPGLRVEIKLPLQTSA